MSLERVVTTGATGFVGRRLAARLERATALSLGASQWRESLARCDFRGATVLHLAARVPGGGASESEYQHDNAAKTRALAQQAGERGARRLVFLSTIKVNGDESRGRAFRDDDAPAPADAYARSKWAAERALAEIAAATGLETVVLRAPLVYGAGAGGSLRALARLADSPLPLPFGALDNRRSFIHVDDLVRALIAAAEAPAARGATLLVAHPERLSTRRLVAEMRRRLSRPPRLFRVEARHLEHVAAVFGQGERVRSLTRSLEIDPSRAEAVLAWHAQVGAEAAIGELVGAEAGPR
jgi:nucleoside-diphosphate-sugar epimerase